MSLNNAYERVGELHLSIWLIRQAMAIRIKPVNKDHARSLC